MQSIKRAAPFYLIAELSSACFDLTPTGVIQAYSLNAPFRTLYYSILNSIVQFYVLSAVSADFYHYVRVFVVLCDFSIFRVCCHRKSFVLVALFLNISRCCFFKKLTYAI